MTVTEEVREYLRAYLDEREDGALSDLSSKTIPFADEWAREALGTKQ